MNFCLEGPVSARSRSTASTGCTLLFTSLGPLWAEEEGAVDLVAAPGDLGLWRGAAEAGFVQQVAAGAAGGCPGGAGAPVGGGVCATLASSPNGLEPVLAEGCEVD